MIRIPLTRKIVPLILAIALLGSTPLHGQSVSGTILGTVEDETGAAIPNATVSIKNLGTGLEQSTTSDATGTYTISNLPVGHYSIRVISAGFAAFEISDTELQVAQRATINPVLHVGGVSSQVEVLGTTFPLLNAASSSVSQVIDTGCTEHAVEWTQFLAAYPTHARCQLYSGWPKHRGWRNVDSGQRRECQRKLS